MSNEFIFVHTPGPYATIKYEADCLIVEVALRAIDAAGQSSPAVIIKTTLYDGAQPDPVSTYCARTIDIGGAAYAATDDLAAFVCNPSTTGLCASGVVTLDAADAIIS